MTPTELNQLIAFHTGEDETTIQDRGFSLLQENNDEEHEPHFYDWDAGDITTFALLCFC